MRACVFVREGTSWLDVAMVSSDRACRNKDLANKGENEFENETVSNKTADIFSQSGLQFVCL